YFPATSPTEPTVIAELDADSGERNVVRRSSDLQVDASHISVPAAVSFPGAGGLTSNGFFYAPKNPEFCGPSDELPPLIVYVHGGPPAPVPPILQLSVQFFTSRGIAVVDLNYGGSTGYGREYRDRLRGRWGVVEVEDSVAAARYLADRGDAD